MLRAHGRALVWSSWRPGHLGTRLLKGNVRSPFTAWVPLSAPPFPPGAWRSTQQAWALLSLEA